LKSSNTRPLNVAYKRRQDAGATIAIMPRGPDDRVPEVADFVTIRNDLDVLFSVGYGDF
jgi:hypothetical protein